MNTTVILRNPEQSAYPKMCTVNHRGAVAQRGLWETEVLLLFFREPGCKQSVINDGTVDTKVFNTIKAFLMFRGETILHKEHPQHFYNHHPNRKQLSRFWRSQWFSTGETLPDTMLLWASESRGAIKPLRLFKESVSNLKHGNKHRILIYPECSVWRSLRLLYFEILLAFSVPRIIFCCFSTQNDWKKLTMTILLLKIRDLKHIFDRSKGIWGLNWQTGVLDPVSVRITVSACFKFSPTNKQPANLNSFP